MLFHEFLWTYHFFTSCWGQYGWYLGADLDPRGIVDEVSFQEADQCPIIQTRLSQIQEQPWNSTSAHWKTLHTLIFNWIFHLLKYWWPLEAMEKSYKDTSPVWMDFKNSFAWLIYMKKLIFDYNNFLTYFFRSDGSKNGRSQKSCCNQKSVFSRKSTTQRNFWNPFTPVMYSCNFFQVLLMATSIPGVEKFSWKSVCKVFFNELNWNFRVAPESETTGFVLILIRLKTHLFKRKSSC